MYLVLNSFDLIVEFIDQFLVMSISEKSLSSTKCDIVLIDIKSHPGILYIVFFLFSIQFIDYK
jgi:hypothetical protein